MTYAIIPAAGHSTRMGRPKLALPLGAGTVLGHVILALRDGGIDHTVVVVGSHVPELVPLAENAGAHVCLLAEATSDMKATVLRGLTWLEQRFHPSDGDQWMLVPADHPTMESTVASQLLRATTDHPGYSIWVPTFHGRRGHPVLLRWRHVAGIRQLESNLGVNVYLRRNASETMEVPVESASVHFDLDRPEDYEALQC